MARMKAKLTAGSSHDFGLIAVARSARGLAFGYLAVVLGVELHRRGLTGLQVGLLFSAIVGGASFALLAVRHFADRAGRKRLYLVGYLLQVAGGLLLATSPWWWLAVVGLSGALSAEVNDSGPFTALEQVMLASTVSEDRLLRSFGRYNAAGAVAGAAGAACAGLLQLHGVGTLGALNFAPIIPLALIGAACAWRLSDAVEARPIATTGGSLSHARVKLPSSTGTRSIVGRFSALIALDSLGSGFAIQAFIAYWLAARFGANALIIGSIFVGIGALHAISMILATRLAERFGLLATMVGTHLPSNLMLAVLAFVPSLPIAAALLWLHASLSEMDVPTRNTYLMAIVPARDQTRMASTTSLAKTLARPVGPALAGVAQGISIGLPLFIAGTLKAGYDLALWNWFRKVPLPPSGAPVADTRHPQEEITQRSE